MRRARRTTGLALFAALALAPAARAQSPPDTVRLVWTAPGDDGNIGTATSYSVRMSLASINLSNWDSASVLPGAPAPLAAGSTQSCVARGLSYGTVYYFALRSVDDAGNWSELSNVVRWDWVLDTAPPAAPSGLGAAPQSGSVLVSWSPNAEPDLEGYSVYRSTVSGSGYTRISGSLVSGTQFVDWSLPVGANELYYQVTATDQNGNESGRSQETRVSLSAGSITWAFSTPYPNPSSGLVNFPVTAPSSGAAGAKIEVLDAAGHRVRVLHLGNLLPGAQLVSWDGTNDDGASLAPGIYRARLRVGGSDLWVHFVRVP